jgi:hypothetical protein
MEVCETKGWGDRTLNIPRDCKSYVLLSRLLRQLCYYHFRAERLALLLAYAQGYAPPIQVSAAVRHRRKLR